MSRRNTRIIIILLLTVAVVLLMTFLVRDIDRDDVLFPEISACLLLEGEKEITCFASLCAYEVGYLCAEGIVDAVTALEGPEEGVRVLQDISRRSVFVISGDLHQLAHVVGRSAARNYGGTGDVFNRCPLGFDYGCLHGFFEGALQRAASPSQALTSICDSFGEIETSHDRGICYHGGGHGIMMDASYHLERALAVCGALPAHRNSCYSGVFMENAIGFVAGRVPHEYALFAPEENWLAPCDSIDWQYRYYCYAYHHRNYLPYVYSAHSDDLAALCLGARDDDIEVCLRGLAEAFVTVHNNIIFQTSFPDVVLRDRIARAAYLCDHFPERYISLCHESVISRMIRMSDPREVRVYCDSVVRGEEICDAVFKKEGTDIE